MNEFTYAERAAVYKEAIEQYGEEAQMIVAVEEMSELIKEVCKHLRGKTDIAAVAEEIADATIMLEQLRIIFDCNGLVCRYMDFKVARLRGRLEGEEEET